MNKGMDKAERIRRLAEEQVPPYMVGHIVRYLTHGTEPTGFLNAVFENNFFMAVAHADDQNKQHFLGYARVLNAMPIGSWGSKEAVQKWMDHRGLAGMPEGSSNE